MNLFQLNCTLYRRRFFLKKGENFHSFQRKNRGRDPEKDSAVENDGLIVNVLLTVCTGAILPLDGDMSLVEINSL